MIYWWCCDNGGGLVSVYLQVYLCYSSFSSSVNQTYNVFYTCVCVTLIHWAPDADWIWTEP